MSSHCYNYFSFQTHLFLIELVILVILISLAILIRRTRKFEYFLRKEVQTHIVRIILIILAILITQNLIIAKNDVIFFDFSILF